MINLKAISRSFSKEEQQKFIVYLKDRNKRNDTKNIQLFKLLLVTEQSSKTICKDLYGTPKKAAYHALRKRLFQSIIDFKANANLDEAHSIEMELIKYLITARTFLKQKHYKVAYTILNKAERMAKTHFLFNILNEIYHTKIQFAHLNPNENVSKCIEQYNENLKKYNLENKLNIVYATMRDVIHKMTYHGAVVDFENLLHDTLKTYNISYSSALSFKSIYQLVTLVSLSAFVTNDYFNLEPFLISVYNKVKHRKGIENQLFYHIHVLYLLVNTLFRNKKFTAALSYLEVMEQAMKQQNAKYYNTFKLKWYLQKALNANFLGNQTEAIQLLESILVKKHRDTEALLDVYLALLMFYIQANRFHEAASICSKFYHTDAYYEVKAGKEWVIKKHIAEIILYIELERINLVDSRLLRFKRHYFPYLKTLGQQRVITFLRFVEQYYNYPEEVTRLEFKEKVESAFVWIEAKREDVFVMSFYAWLKSKMEVKPLYSTTIELVSSAMPVNYALKK